MYPESNLHIRIMAHLSCGLVAVKCFDATLPQVNRLRLFACMAGRARAGVCTRRGYASCSQAGIVPVQNATSRMGRKICELRIMIGEEHTMIAEMIAET
eukprot:2505795-Pyramimonas_sp.AAC.1